MSRSFLLLLLSPATLLAQQGCPCPDSVSLFLELDEPFKSRKLDGTPWDVWPEGSFPDIRIMLKPSSKDFDCGPEGCDSLCPGYFKTIVLPREQDNKKTITITLPDQSPITLPGCTITRGVCEEVTTSAGFENVTLPNEPFHFFAVDQDILLHDLIFEHSTNLFRHDFAHENFEHTSTDPLCQLKLSNPANPFVSECALSLRGKRVGRVIIVKDPNAVISYRNAPLKEPLAKIQDGLRKDFGKWAYSYDGDLRADLVFEKYQRFFDNYYKTFREEQKKAAEPCDIRDVYRTALKYSVKAGPLGFYDPNVTGFQRIKEAVGDFALGEMAAFAAIYNLAAEQILSDTKLDQLSVAQEGANLVRDALDRLIETDYTEMLRKASSADETLEILNGLDNYLGGTLSECDGEGAGPPLPIARRSPHGCRAYFARPSPRASQGPAAEGTQAI